MKQSLGLYWNANYSRADCKGLILNNAERVSNKMILSAKFSLVQAETVPSDISQLHAKAVYQVRSEIDVIRFTFKTCMHFLGGLYAFLRGGPGNTGN